MYFYPLVYLFSTTFFYFFLSFSCLSLTSFRLWMTDSRRIIKSGSCPTVPLPSSRGGHCCSPQFLGSSHSHLPCLVPHALLLLRLAPAAILPYIFAVVGLRQCLA
ncbi:hypothetical protein AAHE18_02G117300 [Arachis hypogaea]